MPTPHRSPLLARRRCTAQAVQLLMAWPLLQLSGLAGAAVTDLANAPLGTGITSASIVKPNVAMVIDDSGSMAFPNLPNDIDHNGAVDDPNANTMYGNYCYGNRYYNTMAYDPTRTYTPPFDPSATNNVKSDASFLAALYDGFAASNASSTYDGDPNAIVNLSLDPTKKPIKLGHWPSGQKRAYIKFYYADAKGTKPSASCESNTNYTPITSASDIEAPGVTKGSDAAKTNYANWYSYYRTRGLMMKTATGRAFSDLSDSYRVGLFFINGNTNLRVSDFDSGTKTTWYSTLYGSSADGSTPLRNTLANIGRMYAGKGPLSNLDPVQYSCQQNFTILSTDGYWNDSTNPKNLNGNSIGDVDSGPSVTRPYLDANSASNTLADTAYYYYTTDLRSSSLNNCSNTIGGTLYSNLCDDNVPTTKRDTAITQHMTTFALGLGVSGTITYEANYEIATNTSATQYFDILNGTADWPDPTKSNSAKVDDLWHAAVNGRGVYYSASDPGSLVRGLSDALAGISARLGSATAAATSSLEPVAGDNAIYLARYRTVKWDGELLAKTIDPNTGVIATTALWNAQAKLDAQVSGAKSGDGRIIKYFNSSASNSDYLKDFTFTNLDADGLGSYFTKACSSTSPAPLSQCANLTSTQKSTADIGDNLVKYLRGQSTYEAEVNAINPLYRDREHLLGDVVNAVPVYVKKPQFNYEQYDLTYGTFKTNNASRLASVYLAANDGMLHAIDGDSSTSTSSTGGTERWAFVPSFVMPNMRQLADTNYAHRYYVDGSPTAADICTNPTTATSTTPSGCNAPKDWKTIVIGGLNKGGCGYYALDVTDPTSPKGLWEFTNANLGYSFGNPVVTRRSDGKWVVLVTSGYNNIPGTCGKGANVGDGQGHLFVLDAATGTLLDDISTGVGSSSAPSNLGKLNVWVENAQLNTADAAYAGDMLGNVWRFDFDNKYGAAGKDAFLLATLKDPSGNAQPITVKPELAYLKNSRIVMVGTGKLLATSDLNDEQVQSLYGLKDDLTATSGIGNPRSSANAALIKARRLTSLGSNQLTLSGSDINWANDKGWYLDFITDKERVNVEMQLQYNTLTVATNVPEPNACTAGGYSWLYYLDISTGKYLPTSVNSMVGYRLGNNALVAGIRTIKLQNGKTVTVVTDSLGDSRVENAPTSSSSGGSGARRTMWREIQD